MVFEVLSLIFIGLVFVCGYCFGRDKRPEINCGLNLKLKWTPEGTVVHIKPVGCEVVVESTDGEASSRGGSGDA